MTSRGVSIIDLLVISLATKEERRALKDPWY